jgi:3-methyladenine DNA glycosylase AlkD
VDQAQIRSDLLDQLSELANPEYAQAMQAYMKSEMPFWGVKKPLLKQTLRSVLADYPKLDWVDARDTAAVLWEEAQHREELHLALALTGFQRHRKHLDIGQLPFFEAWITQASWWDLVDDIAANRLGAMYKTSPGPMSASMRAWAQDDHLWKRRSAIISQLKRKADCELGLLTDCIEPNIHRTEFWLRKAIGWALRDVGRFHPEWVVEFVEGHPELSGLSRREAMKHLGK